MALNSWVWAHLSGKDPMLVLCNCVINKALCLNFIFWRGWGEGYPVASFVFSIHDSPLPPFFLSPYITALTEKIYSTLLYRYISKTCWLFLGSSKNPPPSPSPPPPHPHPHLHPIPIPTSTPSPSLIRHSLSWQSVCVCKMGHSTTFM